MNKILDNEELNKLTYERDKIRKLLETTNIEFSGEREALETLLELKEKEISHKENELGINKILYEQELKELVSERNKLENLLKTTNNDGRKSLETLLELKKDEISDKINTINYYSLMIAPVHHYIEKLFKHFLGGYEWKIKKRGVELDYGEGTYWISFGDYLSKNQQEYFIRYINHNEYNSPASPECIFTNFYKMNDNAKDDIDKLEPISDFPNYVEDFMSYIIMWRIENKSIVIPEENLKEIYNTIIEKYSLDKEKSLKRVK